MSLSRRDNLLKLLRREVYRNFRVAGEKRELFVAPTYLLKPEVSWENSRAYVYAYKSFRFD